MSAVGLLLSVFFAASFANVAIADEEADDHGYESYQGYNAGLFLPDSSRNADTGFAIGGYLGHPMDACSAVEFGLFAANSTGDAGGTDAYVGASAALNWGRREPGSWFALLGGGGVQQDTALGDEFAPFVDAGVGFYAPFDHPRDKMRVELRWHGVMTDMVPDKSMLSDLRLMVGVMVGGSLKPVVSSAAPPVAPEFESLAEGDAVASSDGEPAQPARAAPTLDELWRYNLYFELDSYLLSEDELDVAKLLAEALMAHPDKVYELAGFADPTGAPAHNQQLSLRRAKFVYDYLFMLGVDRAQMQYRGRGVSELADFPETERAPDENARARRVETRVLK